MQSNESRIDLSKIVLLPTPLGVSPSALPYARKIIYVIISELDNKMFRRSKMITTIDDFIYEFEKIRELGWVRTHRSGNTGIGKTLEDLLGIAENNLQDPDFGEFELKAGRKFSNSMLTIITKSPLPYGSNTALRHKYGYSSSAYDNDEKVLHSTLNAVSFTPIASTGNSLRVGFDSEKIFLYSPTEVENVYWDKEGLKACFERKISNKIVYVKAEAKGAGINEEFHFDEAYLLHGFSYEAFIDLLEQGKIYVDLRIGQYPDGRTHDHGTGFRIRDCHQDLLFLRRDRLV